MTKCPHCQSTDIDKSQHDAGHFKGERTKPVRMYYHLCKTCGYVALFAERSAK